MSFVVDLQSDAVEQYELALEGDAVVGRSRLREALDGFNLRYGRGQ